MNDKRVADYFIISGVPEKPNSTTESKPLIRSPLPITDVTVIIRELGEECPVGYTCIETTPGGHSADLNNGNLMSQNIQICYRRGNDKPPLIDVGVYHADKERVLPDVEVVYRTPYGRSASTAGSDGTYITFRRAKVNNPYNQLVVVDLCVILNNKSERAPHAFYSIKKNLNKSYYGMIGSEVFLCYKKTLLSPPSLSFTPQIISRFPLQDYHNFPLPDSVPLFCLPTGAHVERWPAKMSIPRPSASTFVLTSDSAQKVYGSSLTFYEHFDPSNLSLDHKVRLGVEDEKENPPEENPKYRFYCIKSICLLSKWPFFDCFEKFLLFLYRRAFSARLHSNSHSSPIKQIPIEHHISHFLLDVSFPSPQRPTVMVQLMPGTDETVTISQPFSKLPLPLTGASFIQLLVTLGVENTMNVLLFGLSEQKILLHSLKPWALTGVAEAITAMLFPFHWQCPYVPLCPLSLYGILNAPLPFIVGIDSRCFDTFTPPSDIICVDLDTKSIFQSESKRCLTQRILPRRAARVLKSSLEKIHVKIQRFLQLNANQSPQHRGTGRQQAEKEIELEIQEAFVRFMASILKGFRTYLLPITRAPTVGATDPTSLFNFEGFFASRDRSFSQFYQLITKTQMFAHYIEERSFVSDKDTSLAFFDDCEEKLIASENLFMDRPVNLFNFDDGRVQTDRSVYIPAPELSPSSSASSSFIADNSKPDCQAKFGPLNASLFHRHPQISHFRSLDKSLHDGASNQVPIDTLINEPNSLFSISRRTKHEVKASQKEARKSAEKCLDWSKYLARTCYGLWFSTLPSYIIYCRKLEKTNDQDDAEADKRIARILRYAFITIVKMRKMQLTPDEICFRILTLLCGHYGQPALAVRVFFEMKQAGIKPNAVTYGYYNKAVLESKWPDHSSKPTTVLWAKIRNVINGVALFKFYGRLARDRRIARSMPFAGDPSLPPADAMDNLEDTFANQLLIMGDFFHPTTLPIRRDVEDFESDLATKSRRGHHRRSLINKSFAAYPVSSVENVSEAPLVDLSEPTPLKNSIHKSYSMHLRNRSPDHGSLVKQKSSSMENSDSDPNPTCNASGTIAEPAAPTQSSASYRSLEDFRTKYQLFDDRSVEKFIFERPDLIDSPAGILMTANQDVFKVSLRSICTQTEKHTNHDNKQTYQNDSKPSLGFFDKVRGPHNNIRDQNLLLVGSFGEDARILRKLDRHEESNGQLHAPSWSANIGSSHADKNGLGDIGQAADMSQVQHDDEDGDEIGRDDVDDDGGGCEDDEEDEDEDEEVSEDQLDDDSDVESTDTKSTRDSEFNILKNFASTPNKFSNLINMDGSSLQWSKWTSSHNSKSVYKNLKNAATGIVSSFQEIKHSFSISNSNTPAKLLTTAKSTATREMLSQWANYFTSQPARSVGEESDDSSVGSNDLLRLTQEDAETIDSESKDFKNWSKMFEDLQKHYGNARSKEDLVDHVTSVYEAKDSKVALEVTMTTCSRCNVCHSLLYDEEIMEGWSHNESNLNTRCVYCRAKIVPLMSIDIDDLREGNTDRTPSETGVSSPKTNDTSTKLVDFGDEDDGVQLEHDKTACESSSKDHRTNDGPSNRQSFTVPYLSPIVLRKELESVFETSGDSCPSGSQFVDEHPIIYWNLLWFLSRINTPTHLAMLLLSAKSISEGREQHIVENHNDQVLVKLVWDNEKLHVRTGKPLYRLIERGNPSRNVQAILCDEIYFGGDFLQSVVDLIKANELCKAMNMVLNARLKSSSKFSFDKNRHNLYRDLIFLTSKALNPSKPYMDNFEREYKRAFESLNFQQVALNRFDRPPSTGSLFCRKCFKELNL